MLRKTRPYAQQGCPLTRNSLDKGCHTKITRTVSVSFIISRIWSSPNHQFLFRPAPPVSYLRVQSRTVVASREDHTGAASRKKRTPPTSGPPRGTSARPTPHRTDKQRAALLCVCVCLSGGGVRALWVAYARFSPEIIGFFPPGGWSVADGIKVQRQVDDSDGESDTTRTARTRPPGFFGTEMAETTAEVRGLSLWGFSLGRAQDAHKCWPVVFVRANDGAANFVRTQTSVGHTIDAPVYRTDANRCPSASYQW